MNTQEYFKIGSEVNYLRHDNELKVLEESGIVRAIFIGIDDRLMAQVKNGDNAYNVHYMTLIAPERDHDRHDVENYAELLQNIRSTSDKGDALVQEVVDNYNGQVQQLTTDLMGEPVEFDICVAEPSLEDVAGNA